MQTTKRKFRRQVRIKRLFRAQRSLSAAINAHRDLAPVPRDLGVLPAAVFVDGFAKTRKRHEDGNSRLFAILDELQTEFEMLRKTSELTILCTFGPPGDRLRHWILKFEEAGIGDMHFDDEGEAIKSFLRYESNWNCTLFVTACLPDWSDA